MQNNETTMNNNRPYRPFSNASEFMIWTDRNCDKCVKGPSSCLEGPNTKCDIENSLVLASLCGGSINDDIMGGEVKAKEIAERLGWTNESEFPSRCLEFQKKSRDMEDSHNF